MSLESKRIESSSAGAPWLLPATPPPTLPKLPWWSKEKREDKEVELGVSKVDRTGRTETCCGAEGTTNH